jgi:catalase
MSSVDCLYCEHIFLTRGYIDITYPLQQTMTPHEAMSDQWRYIALDVTKIWPHVEFPLQEIGKLVLNENPKNYFDEIEQVR